MNIINEKVVEYLDGLYKPLNDELHGLRIFAEQNHVPIILRDSEEFILNLLRIKKPKRILEIGTAVGYSACCFATVCKDSEILTLESDNESRKIAEANIQKLGYHDRITVLLGDATETLKELDENLKFDFVFIDAGKSHYKEFFDASLRLCAKDAVLVSDNVLLKAKTVSDEYDPAGKYKTNTRKMREYIEYIIKIENIHTSISPVGDGLAVSVIGGKNE